MEPPGDRQFEPEWERYVPEKTVFSHSDQSQFVVAMPIVMRRKDWVGRLEVRK